MNLKTLSTDQILLLSKADLMEGLIAFAKELEQSKVVPKAWLNVEETKALLGIRSSTTLFKWKNEGRIAFAQPSRKILLFERASIEQFLNDNKQKTF